MQTKRFNSISINYCFHMFPSAWLPCNSTKFIEHRYDVTKPESSMDVITYVAAMCILNEDDNCDNDDNSNDRLAKFHHYNYNHSHAKAAIWRYFLCLYPVFDNEQFQSIFVLAMQSMRQ